MEDWIKIVLGSISILICTAVVSLWKLIVGKVGKEEFNKVTGDLSKRIDDAVISASQLVSKTDMNEKFQVSQTRGDDKEIRTQRDLLELKTDVKSLRVDLTAIDKKLDELPARVVSLEATRNKNA